MGQSLHMFINIWFFARGFECFVEKSGCAYIVVAEAKKLIFVDHFISLFCQFVSIVDILKEVGNWCWCILTCSHGIKIGCEVR